MLLFSGEGARPGIAGRRQELAEQISEQGFFVILSIDRP
jgi:hypothetical protein